MSSHVLVLGSRVRNDQPMQILVTRLQRAHSLVEGLIAQGEDPVVVVSGAGESGPMRTWLIEHGMDPARIHEETDATSTNENLENAHALFPDVQRWLVVTSDFHRCRTALWARHLGIPVRVIPARTPLSPALRQWAREAIATPHSALRVAWRRIRS